jgi:transposase
MEAVKHGQMTLAWSPKAKNQKRKWRLLVPCEVEVRDRARGNLVAGVDLGVCHLAVVSIPELRKCCYFSRHDLPHRQRWLDEKRRRAQQAGGPQASARWRDRERAWTDTAIQETARRIVAWLARFEGAGIVQLEDLNGLSEGATRRDVGGATARMLKRFPYGKLGDRVQQAAEAEGFEVRRVPAAYTSQTCSRCGRLGRRRARRFVCDACGLALCADLNAANNIAKAQAIA